MKQKKNLNKRNFFIRNFIEGWKYVCDSRNYIYFIVGLFLLFVLAGLIFPAPQSIIDAIKEFIKKLIEKTAGLNGIQLIAYIFLNNLLASFFGLFLGALFGIIPILIACLNGYVLGFVAKISVSEAGIFSLWRIFPHGIFELPAVFISLGLGIKLGMSLFKESDRNFLGRLLVYLRVFFFIVLPLLVVAAIIEGGLIKVLG